MHGGIGDFVGVDQFVLFVGVDVVLVAIVGFVVFLGSAGINVFLLSLGIRPVRRRFAGLDPGVLFPRVALPWVDKGGV